MLYCCQSCLWLWYLLPQFTWQISTKARAFIFCAIIIWKEYSFFFFDWWWQWHWLGQTWCKLYFYWLFSWFLDVSLSSPSSNLAPLCTSIAIIFVHFNLRLRISWGWELRLFLPHLFDVFGDVCCFPFWMFLLDSGVMLLVKIDVSASARFNMDATGIEVTVDIGRV